MRTLVWSVLVGLVVSAGLVVAQEEAVGAGKSVLVAAAQSKYKKTLVASLVAALEKRGFEVDAIDLKALTTAKASGNAAVVVVASVPDWRKKGALESFMASADAA